MLICYQMACNICLNSQLIKKCKFCTFEVCFNCVEKLISNNYKMCPICQQFNWFLFEENKIELIEKQMDERYQQIMEQQFYQSIRYTLINILSICFVLFFLLIFNFYLK